MNTPPAEQMERPDGELPQVLKNFIYLALGLTVGCLLVEVFCAQVLHWPYPFNWPLFEKGQTFWDFILYKPRYTYFHSPLFFSFKSWAYMYPAPMALIYRFFYYFPYATQVFITTLTLSFVIAACLFARELIGRGVSPSRVVGFLGATLACSYAIFFDFERGNMEFVIWVLVASGVWAFLRGRGYTAAACFGIAGAMKLYPLVFIGLLISRKRYREAGSAVGFYFLTTVASLWLVCPDIAVSWKGVEDGLAKFREGYMFNYGENSFDHSLFALFKALLGTSKYITHSAAPPGRAVLAPMLAVYTPVVALGGIVLYFLVIRRLPIANQVLCLTVASILLPPVSHDYTLVHLYVPWALFVVLALQVRARVLPGFAACFVCMAILLSPETEFILHRHSVGAQIKAVTLILLAVVALRHRFPSSYDVEPTVTAV